MKNIINKYINKNIGKFQYMVLVIFLSRSFLYGIGLSNIFIYSKYDTWLSILIGILLGFIPILLLMHLNKKNINLFDAFTNNFIKYIIVLITCFSFTVLLNDFINFSSNKYLFDTNNIIISLLFIVPSIYIVNKGPETIGRSALFMFYISVILFIIVSISLVTFIDLNNLKPMFITNKTSLLNGSLRYICYTISPILLLNVVPKNNLNYKEYNKYLLIGYIVSSLSILIIIIFTTTIYNYEYISLFNYPIYYTIKKIEYDFLSNPENLFSLFFIIDYFYSILVYLFIIKHYLNKELKLNGKSLNITFIIIILILTYVSLYIYEDINIVHLLSDNLLFYVFLSFIIGFIIITIFKRNKN